MAGYVRAYTISFESENGLHVANRDITLFLKEIENLLSNSPSDVIRRINGKLLRVHAYKWNEMNEDYFVVPLGKLKEADKPYGNDPKTQQLVDIPQDMFDVNSLAYHATYRIALVSTNQSGPVDKDIENYFNSYLLDSEPYKLRLKPIKRNIELENIRNAKEATSIDISLNISKSLHDFVGTDVNQDMGVLQHLHALLNHSKQQIESNTFKLSLGLGKGRGKSMDLNALLTLLDAINLDADCIDEITVNYRHAKGEKIDVAKLKNSTSILTFPFFKHGNRLSAEYILDNMHQVLSAGLSKYYDQVQSHFNNIIEEGDEYVFQKDWIERPLS